MVLMFAMSLKDSRIGSVAEDTGGTARHTRAPSVSAPTVVAGCRRLRFVPQPCQMQGSVTHRCLEAEYPSPFSASEAAAQLSRHPTFLS